MCLIGYYGYDCEYKCSVFCRGNILCNYIMGVCNEGCKEGWNGFLCGDGV